MNGQRALFLRMPTISEKPAGAGSSSAALSDLDAAQATPRALQARATGEEPLRILHVVGTMDRGGVETWLMHVLRHIDRRRFVMDFLAQTTNPGQFDEEIRDLGSRVLYCLHPHRPWLYAAGMRRVLAANQPYHIIHSHLHHYSGFVLRLAKSAGVPGRIAHSHNDTSPVDASAGWSRRVYLNTTQRWVLRYATVKLAASRQAGLSLFGPHSQQNDWRILPYGAELTPFGAPVNRTAVRAELNLPDDALVVGHVGRFVKQKNHSFLIQIARLAIQRNPKLHFLLVGDGPLRPAVEEQVKQLGLEKKFTFLGVRGDVPRLMLGGMDAFLFPSLHEGLGLVLVEAQASGIPSIYSDDLPEEADVVSPLVHRVSLGESATVWADVLLRVLQPPKCVLDQSDALQIVQRSKFNIDTALRGLESVYGGDH